MYLLKGQEKILGGKKEKEKKRVPRRTGVSYQPGGGWRGGGSVNGIFIGKFLFHIRAKERVFTLKCFFSVPFY